MSKIVIVNDVKLDQAKPKFGISEMTPLKDYKPEQLGLPVMCLSKKPECSRSLEKNWGS